MLNRYLLLILGLLTLFQVSFSIYYSSEIVNQNINYYHNQTILQELKEKHQSLENELYTRTSLTTLKEKIEKLDLVPIDKQINLPNFQ